MDSFNVSTKIIIGGDNATDIFQGMQRIMIVTDKFMHESKKVEYVTEKLEKCNIQYEIFSEVRPDPDVDTVTKGVAMIAGFKPQAVIAFGGGSAIDAAKAIVYFSSRVKQTDKCTFIAIPTTSGTGSEVTSFAVISDPAKNAKYPLVEDSLLPDYSILDAELIRSVPPAVTADTGIDVLTHAVEGIVSNNANDFTDAAAEKAIQLFHGSLMKAYKTPNDMEARKNMHNASCLAGISFNSAGLGLNHGMAHTLGAHFHIPHGRANGILLPYVISYNAGCYDSINDTAEKYVRVARLLNVESVTVRQSCLNLIRCIKQYIEKLHMPSTIQEAGVSRKDFEENLDEMVRAALADRCTATNPRTCTFEEVSTLFRMAYFGK